MSIAENNALTKAMTTGVGGMATVASGWKHHHHGDDD
jgi:hypothetical protein